MMKVERTAIVPHPVDKMFELVAGVEDYPKFLPWCSDARILERKGDIIQARLSVSYLMVKQSFTTKNTEIKNQAIHMDLIEGPFHYLEGFWEFKEIKGLGCHIRLYLKYAITKRLLANALGRVFDTIAYTLMDAFIKEAERRYG